MFPYQAAFPLLTWANPGVLLVEGHSRSRGVLTRLLWPHTEGAGVGFTACGPRSPQPIARSIWGNLILALKA